MLVNVQESGGSLDDRIERVQTAWQALRGESPEVWSYVCDVFPEAAFVKYGDYANPKYWRVPYTLEDSAVTFAPREQWASYTLDYVPVTAATETSPTAATETVQTTPVQLATPDTSPVEAATPAPTPEPSPSVEVVGVENAAEITTVEESFTGFLEAVGKKTEAVIIVQGESANGRLYTEAALHSGIPIFTGRPVFADHPTSVEETQRPERSVRDVVGRLGQAYVGQDKHGEPALRAPLIISESETGLRTKIKEGILGDLSIRAQGSGRRNGDGMFVVERFLAHPHTSVDLVTVGAAGGYVDLAESLRETETNEATADGNTAPSPDPVAAVSVETTSRVIPVQEAEPSAEILLLRESQRQLLEENTRLFRQARSLEGGLHLQRLLRDSTLPTPSRQRLVEQAKSLIEAYSTHGSPQSPEQLQTALAGLVEAEKAYLAQVLPHGVVTGLHAPFGEEKTVENLLTEAFKGLVPDALLGVAVRGRHAV
ncbi:MAG: hypothetical protein DPW16_22110 [Chloroflexi bacterium]|nr:hypothetical protein [Chloroflexota bacterium]